VASVATSGTSTSNFQTGSNGMFANPNAPSSSAGDYYNWDWKQIEAAINGGSEIVGQDGQEQAASISDPATLWAAGDTFEYVSQVLDNGNTLSKAQATVSNIDSWYANQAIRQGVRPRSNGLIPVSQVKSIPPMMTHDMLNYALLPLARNYGVTIDSIIAPTPSTFSTGSGGGPSSSSSNSAAGPRISDPALYMPASRISGTPAMPAMSTPALATSPGPQPDLMMAARMSGMPPGLVSPASSAGVPGSPAGAPGSPAGLSGGPQKLALTPFTTSAMPNSDALDPGGSPVTSPSPGALSGFPAAGFGASGGVMRLAAVADRRGHLVRRGRRGRRGVPRGD
jgi:hypothetical protein